MKILLNSFTVKNPTTEITINGKYKGTSDNYLGTASHDNQLYCIEGLKNSNNKISVSKIGHIGIVTVTDFTVLK